jgi:bifunctional non-homologous end joining protein LigD
MRYARPKAPAGGVKAAFPGFVAPALVSSIGKVPAGSRWLHEVKSDGYRVQLHIANESIRVYPRGTVTGAIALLRSPTMHGT